MSSEHGRAFAAARRPPIHGQASAAVCRLHGRASAAFRRPPILCRLQPVLFSAAASVSSPPPPLAVARVRPLHASHDTQGDLFLQRIPHQFECRGQAYPFPEYGLRTEVKALSINRKFVIGWMLPTTSSSKDIPVAPRHSFSSTCHLADMAVYLFVSSISGIHGLDNNLKRVIGAALGIGENMRRINSQ
ncbi:uncharacterized protein LOC119297065 [Triticum dicoccoides]|uniref:uncharacterized protein LOC119297065 n=1 Tax=Triticum dicoccoides TaxID=85692 RepID=UPI00188FFBBB|nr:uncharacterized protein LOC119297065 [Triticum dicoccoides]